MSGVEILSSRGRPKLSHSGYLYVFDKCSSDKTTNFWRCEQRGICKARLHQDVDSKEIKTILGEHIHEPDPSHIQGAAVVTRAKKRALETQEPTATVINESILTLPPASYFSLPKSATFKRLVQRTRQQNLAAPHTPKNAKDLDIPLNFATYVPSPGLEEPFVLFDSGREENRVIILGRKCMMQNMEKSRFWFGDGTFSITPPIFKQVYVLLFEMFGTVHPAAYALLPNKTPDTYSKLFGALKVLIPAADPEYFSCDFELAAINTFKDNFPTCHIAGCLFHLTKNILKKVAELGLIAAYNSDPEFNLEVRLLTALVFVPTEDVTYAFEELQISERLAPLLDYFADSYIGRRTRRTRRAPMFPICTWNVYTRTLNNDARTNNFAEAAHRRLQEELSMAHPTIWKFLTAIKKVQKGRDIFFNEVSCGIEPPKKRKKYVTVDCRLKSVVENYSKDNIILYLRSIAQNLHR